jgi:hypothetical protein
MVRQKYFLYIHSCRQALAHGIKDLFNAEEMRYGLAVKKYQ